MAWSPHNLPERASWSMIFHNYSTTETEVHYKIKQTLKTTRIFLSTQHQICAACLPLAMQIHVLQSFLQYSLKHCHIYTHWSTDIFKNAFSKTFGMQKKRAQVFHKSLALPRLYRCYLQQAPLTFTKCFLSQKGLFTKQPQSKLKHKLSISSLWEIWKGIKSLYSYSGGWKILRQTLTVTAEWSSVIQVLQSSLPVLKCQRCSITSILTVNASTSEVLPTYIT